MMNKIIIPGKPISVNALYFGRRFLTKEGRELKQSMMWQIKSQWKNKLIDGPVSVSISLFYEDKKRRDIDNPTKALLDCMTMICFYDDSQITELHITKSFGTNRVELTVTPL